jgi:hypothetical protein
LKKLGRRSIGSFMSDAYAAEITFWAEPVSAIADIRVPFTKPDKPCLILVYFVCLFLGWKCSKSSDQVE